MDTWPDSVHHLVIREAWHHLCKLVLEGETGLRRRVVGDSAEVVVEETTRLRLLLLNCAFHLASRCLHEVYYIAVGGFALFVIPTRRPINQGQPGAHVPHLLVIATDI